MIGLFPFAMLAIVHLVSVVALFLFEANWFLARLERQRAQEKLGKLPVCRLLTDGSKR